MRQRGLRHRQGGGEFQVDHAIPLVDRRLLDRAHQHEPGVVHQDVEAAEYVDVARDRGIRLTAVGDVGDDRERAARGAGDLGRKGIEAVGAAGDERDGGALGGEGTGGGRADPLERP